MQPALPGKPEEKYGLPRDDILTVEEIGDLVDVVSELGVDKVRLTAEPLLRRERVDVAGAASGPTRSRSRP